MHPKEVVNQVNSLQQKLAAERENEDGLPVDQWPECLQVAFASFHVPKHRQQVHWNLATAAREIVALRAENARLNAELKARDSRQ